MTIKNIMPGTITQRKKPCLFACLTISHYFCHQNDIAMKEDNKNNSGTNNTAAPRKHSKTWEAMMRFKGSVTVNDRSLLL